MIYGTRADSSIEDRIAAESVRERVFLAVQELCVGRGDVRSRLIPAINTLLPLSASEFPEVLQSDFEWVMSESMKYKSDIPMHRSDLEATMKRIYNSTGEKIAQRIFDMYKAIQDIRGFPLLGNRKPSE
ncbi:hypothetical protein [Vibrio gigantis]|uniref:Uncharacterized protein n=1 Tax=Vibrio gigantis TaxID=296199 RepID=A0A5M9P3Z5_9VIBR|nr:hypothetical protein [Vibrio gigantis]KAA8679853.1 hypothetical protein F4W18_06430 [Vibrio gigantis]